MFARTLRIAILASACWAGAAMAQDSPDDGLLFSLSGEHGTTAETGHGGTAPLIVSKVGTTPDGRVGKALRPASGFALAWPAPGNMYAQHGTLSFFFRAGTPVGTTPFPIFRAGSADGTSWDMTFLRIDWNGHGFDAFVTDTGLARTRVSFRVATPPAPDAWTHIAFAWDEQGGVRLWIDGKPVARNERKAVYDAGLFGFGPFQRVIAPYQVQSAYNYLRTGDIDEVRVYDHALDDAAVATLAQAETPAAAAPPCALADAAVRADWAQRYGWNQRSAPLYLANPVTAIRKVEFTDTRDEKEKMFRGADGIRETTWPGVYNRSRLLGRHDYFELPDWNVYATGGQHYTLTLPDEAWNRVEINGPAYGTLARESGDGAATVLTRAAGLERTSTQLGGDRHGGVIRFDNIAQETPIEEIGVYHVAPGQVPAGLASFDYVVDPTADPSAYPPLDDVRAHIAGRFVADERRIAVALPAGAPRRPVVASASDGMPIVHILVPCDFRDTSRIGQGGRFSYGAVNLGGGLDGVAIDLPALKVTAGADGLVPLNIRVKDPTWDDRDLLDINVAVKPGEARTLWLDTRDRILPESASLHIVIASAAPDFDAAALAGTHVRLVYKPAAAAKAEHVADRLEQSRDNLAFLVEEQPNTDTYPIFTRYARDIGDVLRVDPDNAVARAYWVEKNPDQPYAPLALEPAPAGVPLWAFRQTEDLKLYRKFVDWWIDHRQIADGEFGGGLSDDTDLVNQWVPLALMGVEPERLAASQRRVLDATFENGMWSNGLSRIRADELHSYEDGINTVAQAMQLDWGDPSAIERGMAVARNYQRLTEVNPAGHRHFVTSYYSGTDVVREGVWGWQKPYSLLVLHPGLLLVNYNGAPAVKDTVLGVLDGWLAHGKQDDKGGWRFPAEIEWKTDAATGTGVASAANAFWAAWDWTGDTRYLRPMASDMARHDLSGVSALNADLMARTPGGASLAATVAAGKITGAGGEIDRNLGGSTDKDFARFVTWQQRGDTGILADLYGAEILADRHRMPVLTDAHLWSDRVAVPSEILQRTRLGGVAHRRNAYYPGNLVRWRFDGAVSAEQVGILIPNGDPERFTVTTFNMAATPASATMTGDQLAAGTWRLTERDGDAAPVVREVTLEHGHGVALTLPSRQTATYAFERIRAGDEPATRPDIGLSVDDLALARGKLSVTVHSLGAKPTPPGTATLVDATGRTIGSARFAGLAAPLDLLPKTATVALPLPRGVAANGLRVTLTLDGTPPETSAANNTAVVGSHIADAPGLPPRQALNGTTLSAPRPSH
ncbi:LamG-like jellyroll fold domain-containing protein [Sphingomonas sp. GC_Shp_3]|uniref:LamG-like jellyroll fold domain-containing protein n=1 Tax=Sphingomonas sp. GC_Shp_3 TaxID=2937383 RepID=UPI002269CCF6|nr:LamG-like jellyroll fold domain-containing protein [Sphingomonas sp. GC_Shp_3]